MLKIELDEKLAMRSGNRLNYILYMHHTKTFGQLMVILRKKIHNIEAGESVFLLHKNCMIPMHRSLGSLDNSVLELKLMIESAFGSWDRIYVRSEIKQLADNCFIATIWYKYYWYSEYTDKKYFVTKIEAKEWILEQRTHGCLVVKAQEQVPPAPMPYGVIIDNEEKITT